MPDMLEKALQLRSGLRAWFNSDRHLRSLGDGDATRNSRLKKAFRDNWDDRVGNEKFGGVWSIDKAKKNDRHPASKKALLIGRENWTGEVAKVEHAVPVNVLFGLFWNAETPDAMQAVVDAYAVAVVAKEEDPLLNSHRLRSEMPIGWKPGDDPLARWKTVGIEVPGLC